MRSLQTKDPALDDVVPGIAEILHLFVCSHGGAFRCVPVREAILMGKSRLNGERHASHGRDAGMKVDRDVGPCHPCLLHMHQHQFGLLERHPCARQLSSASHTVSVIA
jgi:hypothetical protein